MMVESLLSVSNVLIYGRELADIVIQFPPPAPNPAPLDPNGNPADPAVVPPAPPGRFGDNHALRRQLASADARLARIYGFSFEGHYYDLPEPAIFLVHGPGADPELPRPADPGDARAPSDADRTGLAYTDSSFSDDIRVWSYDKADFTVRLDASTGSFEDVLLAHELGNDGFTYAGAQARGAQARGAQARGAQARGAQARGAQARGAQARGAQARGSSD